ncbi:GGDEF domain-containing protein [Kiloniella sp. b19]|uniref:GGDEF domain-containing protein n=1 Tax=Kiloniella sp. GXU_MW_B19 TaxID=3141326 RepID=UPI0031CEE954
MVFSSSFHNLLQQSDDIQNLQKSLNTNLLFRLRQILYGRFTTSSLFHSSSLTQERTSEDFVTELLDVAAEAEQRISELQERVTYLENLSMTDELTETLNRRGLNRELNRALAQARRDQQSGILILCDLDHFKAINDTYGHAAGDEVLIHVAKILKQNVRANDCIARIGGDEFVVLTPNVCTDKGDRVVHKLSKLMNRMIVPWENDFIPVSASVGHEIYGPETEAFTLLEKADQTMYEAKGKRKL